MAKYCSNCGKEVNKNAYVCLSCGAKINEDKNENKSGKSKVLAGILGIFFGYLGIHNFYLGYNSKGLTQLLMSILSCGVLTIVTGIWGLIEGILILCGNINEDAMGNKLID